MHCMLMDLLHGFEVLSTTEETLFNSRNVSRLVQNTGKYFLQIGQGYNWTFICYLFVIFYANCIKLFDKVTVSNF